MAAIPLVKGFDQPIHDSQQVFRKLLKAMSEPGVIESISAPESIHGLYPSSFAVCQAILDQQTPLWMSESLGQTDIKHNLHFHTGVPIINTKSQALFALINASELDDLAEFAMGDSEYPERSCSLIVQVNRIESLASPTSDNQALGLTGPGIQSQRLIYIDALPLVLQNYFTSRNTRSPLGLDVIFVDPSQLVCLPRSTKVEVV